MWTDRLRLVLRLNALTSLAGGLIAAVAAGWVSETLGIDHVTITRIVGIGLVVFACYVAYLAFVASDPKLLDEVRLVSAGDAGWVIATIIVLIAGILTTAGVVVGAVIGLAVADFGLTQLWFRSKAKSEIGSGSGAATGPNVMSAPG